MTPAQDLNTQARELVGLWITGARTKLSDPGKLDGRELNRLGELIMSMLAWLKDERLAAERKARWDAAARAVNGVRA